MRSWLHGIGELKSQKWASASENDLKSESYCYFRQVLKYVKNITAIRFGYWFLVNQVIKCKIYGGIYQEYAMSIENRVIAVLRSAVHADSLPEGSDLSSPYVIHTGEGLLLDCNDAFTELVARSDLLGTHFSERCPTRVIEKKGDEQIQKAREAGFAQLRRPILSYDGKIHSIIAELQIVSLGGRALFLSSFVVEALDIGKIFDHKKGQLFFMPKKHSNGIKETI